MPPIDFIEDEPKIDFQPAESAGDALSNWKSLDRYPDLPEPERRKKIYSDYLRSRQEDVAAQGEGAFAQALPEALQEPLVSPEEVRKFIFLPDAKPGGVREGIEKSVSSLISAPTTPAVGAAMALTPVAPQVMLPMWAYHGAKDLLRETPPAENASDVVQEAARALLDIGMVGGLGGLRGSRPPPQRPAKVLPAPKIDFIPEESIKSVEPIVNLQPGKVEPTSPEVKAAVESPAPVTSATLDRLEAETEGKKPLGKEISPEELGNEHATQSLEQEKVGGLRNWMRDAAAKAGKTVEEFYNKLKEQINNRKQSFRDSLKPNDLLEVSGDNIVIGPDGLRNRVQTTKRYRVQINPRSGGMIAVPEGDGAQLGLETDSGMHFFNELNAVTQGGEVLPRKLRVIREGLEAEGKAPETKPTLSRSFLPAGKIIRLRNGAQAVVEADEGATLRVMHQSGRVESVPEGDVWWDATKEQPGLTGMGAAVPSEFVPSGKATAVKNAAVDAERQSRGQPPILAPQRLKNSVVWDRVMAKIDREPEWQDRLIQELQEQPRTPSQDEILALDHRYVDLQNEYAKATRDGAQAYSDGRMEDLKDIKARAAIFERQLNELEQVARKVGTEWGRSGQMRQRLMKEDFTLAAMESRWRAAKGFEPLTEKEHSEIAELQRKIALADQKATEAESKFNERIAILEAQKALAEAKALAQPAYEPRILQAAERFAKAMEKKGDEAMARIKARLGRTSAGVDPTILSDVGIVGAAKLTRGLVDFAKWTDAMARDLGDWIREHAQEAWDASQKVFNENLEGFNKGADKVTAEKVKKATDLPGRISATKAAITEKAAKGAGSPLHTEVRKLVRLLVEQDPTLTRDAVIDTVHGILKESMPGITRLEAMDAISGRGKFWTPPKDEVSKRVRDLATQIRLIGHQIDVEAKRPLPRTGYQPDKFSDAARKEQQKLNDLKRQYGVVVTDPNAQLASVLQAIKTRLLNERKDLQERLTKGDFSPRRKLRDVPLDAEAAKAKAEVVLLREKFQKGLDHQRYLLKSNAEKAWLGIKEGLNLSRAILTSWDVSAVFRQGGFIALGNPLRAARGLGPMFKALWSEKNAAAIEAEIQARPNAKLYAQSKLFIAPREGSHLSGMEEAFMSRLASKIPGVAGSGRAYITFLNRLRADTFDALHADLTSKTLTELQAISNYINVATGRGNLGKVAGAAETLSTVFFAPRLVASRFQLLAAEPLYRGSVQTRYLVAKEYAKFLGGLAVIYGLGKLAGATVQTDPRSTDFGKLKFGNTRVDPLSGLSQVTVLLSRLGSGKMMNAKGQIETIRGKVKFGHSSSADLIARFLRSKLSPWIGNTFDVLTGKNVVGETVTPGSVAVNMTVPLALRDIYDVMKEQGIAEGTIISILSLFGMSIQNYDAHKKPK